MGHHRFDSTEAMVTAFISWTGSTKGPTVQRTLVDDSEQVVTMQIEKLISLYNIGGDSREAQLENEVHVSMILYKAENIQFFIYY